MKYFIPILLVLVVSIILLQNDVKAESSKIIFPNQTISIDNVTLNAMIADTEEARVQGLQDQQQLSYNQGMLFVVPAPQVIPIWMPNMKFLLDIIWFDSDGNILHVEKNVPPCTSSDLSTCPVYDRYGLPAKYVLEVTSGFMDKYNISANSKLATSIPEFSSLAGMVIAISLIGVVIISKSSRFHFQ
ncbi:MAG: DUF192 domain-containing protein [Thaumarchaeota archaeon]|nr:DUF192 domain-containing protein [Nitrososphaerota archaeon]